MTNERDRRFLPEEARAEEKSVLDGLEGVYVGFSPTDESGIATGEFELTIEKDTIKMRMATGLEIQEDEVSIADLGLTVMSHGEVAGLLENPSAVSPSMKGFKVGEDPWLLVWTDEDDAPAVRLLMGEMAETLGPTLLFSPKQVERGLWGNAVKSIEQEFGERGILPRLSNQGKALS